MTDATTHQQQAEAEAAAEAATDDAALWEDFDKAENPPQTDDDGNGPSDEERLAADRADDAAAAEAESDAETTVTEKPNTDSSGKAPDGKASGDSAAAKDTQADIWANATPEQRAAIEAARSQNEQLESRDRRLRGQVSALQRQINELSTGQGSATRKPAGGTDEQADGFLASDDWKSFEGEYPEVAGPLGKVISSLQDTITTQGKILSAIGDDRQKEALNEQGSLLEERHPGWQGMMQSNQETFVDWLNHQPRHIREAAVRNADDVVDAEEAADVVGRFKAWMAVHNKDNGQGEGQTADERSTESNGKNQTQPELSGKRKLQLESTTGARGKGPGAATGIPENGDPEVMWNSFERMGL